MDEIEKIENELIEVVGDIQKEHGDGSIYVFGEREPDDIDVISTGSISLDKALGVGGIPRGRVIEIYGPEGSGKTTLAQHIVAEAQQQGLHAAYIDMEQALDPAYARACGVDIGPLAFSQPGYGEEALAILRDLVASHKFGVVIIDSVASLVPKAELEGEVGDSHVGLQARLMSQTCRMLAGEIRRSNTAVVFTNQIRMKIGVMFGNPETTSGGRALKFYATVRLDIRRRKSIKEGGEVIGNKVRVRVVKNKVAPPFRIAKFNIIYGRGISQLDEILEWGADLDVFAQRGSYYYLEGEDGEYVQGRSSAVRYLEEHPELTKELRDEIKKRIDKLNEENES